MNPVIQSLALLTPYDIDVQKVRIGPSTDGGYVFADMFSPEQAVVSYGISNEYRFDEEMARRGHKVYMFDHTIPPLTTSHQNMHFFSEGVAGITQPEAKLYSVADHLSMHGIDGDRMILKMDVECAEFDAIGMMPDTVLNRFEQIVIEVHGLNGLEDAEFRAKFDLMIRKFNNLFTLFHVHANNCDGPNGLAIVAGIPVTSLIELSYVKSSAVRRTTSKTLYPTVYDYPNVNQKDKLLWFFPFLPTPASTSDFGLCEQRVTLWQQMR